MLKVFLDMVGCRLNQSELETFARQFRQAGHTLTSNPESADLIVINTCTVTSAADSELSPKDTPGSTLWRQSGGCHRLFGYHQPARVFQFSWGHPGDW